jgi:hypothetical protein
MGITWTDDEKHVEYVEAHVKVPLWQWREIQAELERGREAIEFREEFWRDIWPGISRHGDDMLRAALAGAAIATEDPVLAQTVIDMTPEEPA